jgi:hypothetical protein
MGSVEQQEELRTAYIAKLNLAGTTWRVNAEALCLLNIRAFMGLIEVRGLRLSFSSA